MTGVFKRIIEKLEENQTIEFHLQGGKPTQSINLVKAIEIVEQEAEQYEECYKDCGECEAYDKEKHHCPKFCKVIKETVKEIEENHNGWIPCGERSPEEYDSIFAKLKGTDKWNDAMFEKTSDVVNVTVVDVYGNRITTIAHTVDGKWHCDLLRINKSYQIIAWNPLPEPYQPKGE